MLLGPRGLVRQALGQAVSLPYQPAERLLAGAMALPERGVRTLLGKDTSDLPGMGEAGSMMLSYLKEFFPAVKAAGADVAGRQQTGQTMQQAQGAQPGWTALTNPAHRTIAGAVDAGYRTVSFFDTFARHLVTKAEEAAQTRRGVTGQAAADEVTRVADYRMLTQDLENYAQKVDELRKAVPAHVGEVMLPFWKIPYNGTKFDLERSPVGLGKTAVQTVANLATGQGRGGVNPTEFYERFARGVIGSAAGWYLLTQVAADRVSGEAPDDQATKDAWRAEGKTPFSIRVPTPAGDRWVPTDMVPGLHQSIVQATTVRDYLNDLDADGKPRDLEGYQRAVWRLIGVTALNSVDRPFFENLTQLQQALRGQRGPLEEALPEYVGNMAGGLVPGVAVLRDVARATDTAVRAPRNVPERIMAGVPGLQGRVPQARDAFGRKLERPDLGGAAGAAERALNPLLGTRARPGIRRYAGSSDAAMDDAIARADKAVGDYAKNRQGPRPTPRQQALARYAGQQSSSWEDWRSAERKRLEAEKLQGKGGGGIPVASLVRR